MGGRAVAQPSPCHKGAPNTPPPKALSSRPLSPPPHRPFPGHLLTLQFCFTCGQSCPKIQSQLKCHLFQEVSLDFLSQSLASLVPSTAVLALHPCQYPSLCLDNGDCISYRSLLTRCPAQPWPTAGTHVTCVQCSRLLENGNNSNSNSSPSLTINHRSGSELQGSPQTMMPIRPRQGSSLSRVTLLVRGQARV